jgi:hypothetical protein
LIRHGAADAIAFTATTARVSLDERLDTLDNESLIVAPASGPAHGEAPSPVVAPHSTTTIRSRPRRTASVARTVSHRMYEIWVSVALLGLWSCVGVIYRNSRRASRQMDDIVGLLKEINAKKYPIA